MRRKYNFTLPLRLTTFYVHMGYPTLVEKGIYAKLTYKLAVKINDAYTNGTDLYLTQEDLDSIPDEQMEGLAGLLHLKYQNQPKAVKPIPSLPLPSAPPAPVPPAPVEVPKRGWRDTLTDIFSSVKGILKK